MSLREQPLQEARQVVVDGGREDVEVEVVVDEPVAHAAAAAMGRTDGCAWAGRRRDLLRDFTHDLDELGRRASRRRLDGRTQRRRPAH
jgi:hypothetical protein